MGEVKMSGGLLFASLAEIRYTNDHRSRRMGGVAEPVNNVSLLLQLAAIAHDKYLERVIVKKTASSYKTCEGQGGLKFNSSAYIHELDIAVTKHFEDTYSRMYNFIESNIIDDEKERLLCAKKLMFFVSYAKNIKADSKFIYLDKEITRDELLAKDKIDFVGLVLAVWHHVVKYLPNNRVAEDTFADYFELDYAKSEYFFRSSKLTNLESIRFALEDDSWLYIPEQQNEEFYKRDVENEHVPLVNNEYYANYIENAVSRLSKIKTVLYPKQPIDFYKIFVCNDVKRQDGYKDRGSEDQPLVSATPKTLLDKYGHFLTLTAPGGVGKSMFLKHMLLCDNRFAEASWLEPCGLVPVLLTLKDYKNRSGTMEEFVFDKIKKFDNSLSFETFKSDLNKGIFLFLFDALDEVNRDLLDEFISTFSDFSDEYNSNSFILSSRPNNFCDSLTNFTSLSLLNFRQEQAEKLVNKFTDFDEEKRKEFIKNINIKDSFKITFLKINDRIRKNPYSTVEGNPLLLTIKFLVFIEKGKYISNDAYLFYETAYEVLYETHDQLHSQFNEREWATKMDMGQLKTALGEFCFITYFKFKYSFTRAEIDAIVDEMKTAAKYHFNASEFIKDLKDNLTLLYVEGGRYSFIHKSFQEFFTAFHLSKMNAADFDGKLISQIEYYRYAILENLLDDEERAKDSSAILKIYDYEMYSVIEMFYQMAKEKCEKFLFLPVLFRTLHHKNPDAKPEEMMYSYIENTYGVLHLYTGARNSSSNNNPFSDVVYFILHEVLKLEVLHDMEYEVEDGAYTKFYLYEAELDGPVIPPDDLVESESMKFETQPDGSQEPIIPEGIIYEISDLIQFCNEDKYPDLKKFIKDEFKEEYLAMYKYALGLQDKYIPKKPDSE